MLGVLLVTFVFFFIQKSNADPDLGWHLRNAQYQLQHHRFLHQDLYSFTTHGKPWMDDEWLGEIPFYLAWRGFGQRGVFALTYALIAGILLGIFGLASMRSRSVKSAFLVSLAAVILASVSFGPRTLLFGWALLIVELAVLSRYREGRDLLWMLPPLFVVWVNAHGSWIIGFVLLGMFAASGLVDGHWGLIDAHRWSPAQRRKLAWIIALSTLALFVNPYGWRLVEYPFDMAFHQKLNIATIIEWQTLDFHSLRGKFALMLLLGGIVIGLMRRRRWPLHELGFLLLGIYSGFTYSRFLFLTAILAAPFLATDLKDWLPPYQAERDKPLLNACIMLACIVAIGVKFPTSSELRQAWSHQYPLQATNYLQHFHPHGRVLNDYLWGGYLEWNVRQIPVFVDSRVDVFERNGVFKDYLDLTKLRGSRAILDKYSIRYVLFEANAPLSYLLEHAPGWKIDYRDQTTILFERNQSTAVVQCSPDARARKHLQKE